MLRWLRRLTAGLRALIRGRRADQELDDELRAYLQTSIDTKLQAGLPRDEAVRRARAEMGSLEAVKDYTRDAGWETAVESLWRDVRYAVRALRKSPAFSAIAIATLALGIGANTAIFTVVNAVLLRPLPVDRPEELISLSALFPEGAEPVFSYAAYRRIAADGEAVVDAIAASSVRRDAISFDAPPEPVDHKWVSGNYFTTLGVRATAGRVLLPSDDASLPGEQVAVISNAYWTRRFGRSPTVVGRTFLFRATPFTIVGVAPPGFFGETGGEAPDMWMPLSSQPGAPPHVWKGHSTTWLGIVGRLRPGVTIARARAALDPVYGRIRADVAAGPDSAEYRKSVLESRLEVSEARGGSSRLRRPLTAPLLILMGIVALVLVIACANVANLMLARAAVKRRQTAVSLAIGANRLRVFRQWMVEAAILAALGGSVGLLLAIAGSSMLVTLVAGALPLSIDVSPDVRVLAFTLVASCVTALVFGVVPGMRAARMDPLPALKATGEPGRGAGRIALRRLLVVVQVAVSLVLLVGAGLFVRSLLRLHEIETGFDADRVLLLQVTPPVGQQPVALEERRHLYRQLLARAEAVPGVAAASASATGLFGRGTWGNAIVFEGPATFSGATPRTLANAVTAQYFDVLRIAILRGRAFTEDDHETAPRVVVVNQTFARQFFGDADPLGRRVGLCTSDPCDVPAQEMREIVGVAEDAKYVSLREEPRSMLYVPFTQHGQALREIEVRTETVPGAVAAALHRELAAVDRRAAIVGMIAAREQVDASLVGERLVAKLSATFGLLALALAAVGLYGVVAYTTAQRTVEIGIRMALGADRRDVRRLVLRDTLTLVGAGALIGLPAALGAARLLASQLYQVGPDDPLTLVFAIATLSGAALLAGIVPARRASRADPLVALRSE